MNKIKNLFPKFDVKVIFQDLKNESGCFWFKSDVIILDKSLKQSLPGCATIVLLHEMFHSTASNKRLMRLKRLYNKFGPYQEGSLSYRLEECIAEFCTMVACIKLGLFNEYSKNVIIPGFEKNYSSDMYIPIIECRAALKYFTEDEINFEDEIEQAKSYLEAFMEIKFQDRYKKESVA